MIGPNFSLPENTKLTTNANVEDDEGNLVTKEIALGANGFGQSFIKPTDPYNSLFPSSVKLVKGDSRDTSKQNRTVEEGF